MAEDTVPVSTGTLIPHLRQNFDLSFVVAPTGRAANVPLGAIGYMGAYQGERALQTGPVDAPYWKGLLPLASRMATGDPFFYPPPGGPEFGGPFLQRSPFGDDEHGNFRLYQPGRLLRLSIVFVDYAWFGFAFSSTSHAPIDEYPFSAQAGLPPRYPPGSKWEWWKIKGAGTDPSQQELLDSGTYNGIGGLSSYNGHEVVFSGPTVDQPTYTENTAVRVAVPGGEFLPLASLGAQDSGPLLGPFYFDG